MSYQGHPRFLCLSLQDNYELLAQTDRCYPVSQNISQILLEVNDEAQSGARQIREENKSSQKSKTALLQRLSSMQTIDPVLAEASEAETTHSQTIYDQTGQNHFLVPLISESGGHRKRKPRPFKFLSELKSVDQLLVKRRSTRNKQYRNDELAKKIIRGIATNYHKWFLANITRSVKRGGKASQQRRVVINLLLHLGISEMQSMEWINDKNERKILDTTFLTVGAKTPSNALKRESIFNGTKRACIMLFKSEVGKALYLESFMKMWEQFTAKQTKEDAISSLQKYKHSILESVGLSCPMQ